VGYSANRKKELGTSTTLPYSQRRKKEIELENLATQSGTTVEVLKNAKYKDAYIARDEEKRREVNGSKVDTAEQEALDAMKKIEDRPWYVPKGIAVTIENVKLSPDARRIYSEKKEEKDSKSATRTFSNAFADSVTLGALSSAEKYTHENYGIGTDEFFKRKEEAKALHPVANIAGTVAGYVTPGALTEKVVGKVLAPALGKIGSKVVQKLVTGAVTGGGMELAEGLIRGDTPEDLANRTATGAALGGIGDAALYGIGKGGKALFNKLKLGKVLTKAETEIVKNADELLPNLPNKIEVPKTDLKTSADINILPKQEAGLKTDFVKINNTPEIINQSKLPRTLNQKEWVGSLDKYKRVTAPDIANVKIEPTIKEVPEASLTNNIGEVKERGFSENIRTDVNRPDAERAIFDRQPEFYNVLNNETTLSAAQKRFSQGYENALKDFDATKSILRADNVPLAKLIADEAVKRGDVQTARRVLVDISESLTTAGQYSQAAKILRESNDPSTILTFVEKEIQKLNTQGTNRYGNRWEGIKLTDDELAKIGTMKEGVTDEQKEQLFGELFSSISTRIPTTAREKFDSWRRIAMLFNPKTHIRNVAGNSMMAGISKISDTIATTLEKGIKPELRTKSFIASKEYKDIATNYWASNKKVLTEGGRWELFGVKTPFAEKKTFKTKWLETLNDISKKTLENEDLMFMKKHFTDNLAGFMQARGLKEPTQEAIEYSTKRAQEATFREANALSDSINKLKGTKVGLIIEAAIPFTKTPANILTTGVRYSPIGLVNSAVQLISKESPAKVIETFSKGLTGSGLTMMGFYMAKNGLARGQYESNAKVEGLKQASGELPNSLITPQGSYTIDWAQPLSIPFFMGVGMAESLKKNDSDYVQAGMDALIAGGDSLINQSMLKNIKDLIGGYGSTTEKVMQLPVNYLTQAFPTVSGQVARIVDPFKRQIDYSTNTARTLTGIKAKTPVISKDLPLKRDILGQPQKYGKGVLNIIQQFISPGYIAKKSDDSVVKELNRLYESEGSDFLPRATVYKFTKDKVEYKLTSEEISEFQRVMGEYTKDKMDSLIQSSGYKSMPDDEKAKKIKAINDDGYELAKQNIIKAK